ncbi:PrpF domain-containing protein [Vibrio metschnikovii]
MKGKEVVNTDLEMLAKLEMIRAHGALKMGLIEHLEQAKARQHTPKIAFVAPSKAYLTASGKQIESAEVDLLVRALSMGKLHPCDDAEPLPLRLPQRRAFPARSSIKPREAVNEVKLLWGILLAY